MARWQLPLIILLALVGASVSGLLLLQHHGEGAAVAAVSQVCGDGASGPSGCEAVAASSYSSVGGVPLASLGVLFYLSLACWAGLALVSSEDNRNAAALLALGALALALTIDLVLLALQAFAIGQFCKLCLLTYAINAAGIAVLFPARRFSALLPAALRVRDVRLALAGWAMASLAVAGGLGAAELALETRAQQRSIGLLGSASTPATASVPAATTPSAGTPASPSGPRGPLSEADRYREEAQTAQEQARRLQEILDDPKKLEQYFTDKAARQFDSAPVRSFDLANAPAKGNGGPIKVVEFSDFLCPYCKSLARAFGAYLPSVATRLTFYFRNYPLDIACNPNLKQQVHAGACLVASGAICAQQQGKFWPYHDRVFATELRNPTLPDVVNLGAAAGLDRAALETCIAAPATKQALAAEIAEAKEAGVQGTPALYINGKQLPRIDDFLQTLDKEAARLGLPPLPKPVPAGGQ